MLGLVGFVFFIFALMVLIGIFMPSYEDLDGWHHTFDNVQFSIQDFYRSAEASISVRQIPGVKLSRITYQEQFIVGLSREYLRIERDILVFDICAAPFLFKEGLGMVADCRQACELIIIFLMIFMACFAKYRLLSTNIKGYRPASLVFSASSLCLGHFSLSLFLIIFGQ